MKNIHIKKRKNLGKIVIILLSFMGYAFQGITQDCMPLVNHEWVATYSSQDSIVNTATAIDVNGNVYVTGYTYSVATGGDYTTIKYNSEGDILWVSNYTGTGNGTDRATALATDDDCNVYVTGYSFDSGSDLDYATIKYDSLGKELWVKRYNGPGNSTDVAKSLVVDTIGNVYITGFSEGAGTSNDYATIKYDSDGLLQWIQRFDGAVRGIDVANSLTIDDKGNVYVNGRSFSRTGFFDITTIKYHGKTGILGWVAITADSLPFSELRSFKEQIVRTDPIVTDGSGNIYIATSTGSGSNSDFLTIKLNTSGSMVWAELFDGMNLFDAAKTITVDKDNDVYVSGISQLTLDTMGYAVVSYYANGAVKWSNIYDAGLNPGSVNNVVIAVDSNAHAYIAGSTHNGLNRDIITIGYDSEGHEKWRQIYSGTANGDDMGADIAVDEFDNVYVTGQSYNGNNFDYATIKYSQQPDAIPDIQSILDIELFDSMLVFRNVPHYEQVLATLTMDEVDVAENILIAQDTLQVIRDNSSGNSLLNKLNSALSNLEFAFLELADSIPNYNLGTVKMRKAIMDVENAVDNFGMDAGQGIYIMNLITNGAFHLADLELEYTKVHGSNGNQINVAQNALIEANTLYESGLNGNIADFKHAMTNYLQVLSITESVLPNDFTPEIDDITAMRYFEEVHPEFISLRTVFEQIIDVSEDSLLIDSLEDFEFIASLLNKNGLVKICDRVYKLDFAKNSLYVLNDNEYDYSTYKSDLIASNEIRGVITLYSFADEVFDTIYNPEHYLHGGEGRCPSRWGGIATYRYRKGPYTYRFKGRAYYIRAGIYHELGIKVKHQKRMQNHWKKTNAKNTRLDCRYVYKRRKKGASGYHWIPNNKVKSWSKKKKRTYRIYKGRRSLSWHRVEYVGIGGKSLLNQDIVRYAASIICDRR